MSTNNPNQQPPTPPQQPASQPTQPLPNQYPPPTPGYASASPPSQPGYYSQPPPAQQQPQYASSPYAPNAPTAQYSAAAPVHSQGGGGFSGFFSFRIMVSPIVIKILYILGIIIINGAIFLGAIGALATSTASSNSAATAVLSLVAALLGVIFFNLLWRLLCEWLILFYSIHEVLVSMEKELKRR